MTAILLGSIGGLAGALVALVALLQASKATAAKDLALRDLETAHGRLDGLQSELDATRADMARRVTQREDVVTFLKREIIRLEKDLDACQAPGIIRDRLRRMLSDASGEAPHATEAGGDVPIPGPNPGIIAVLR